jgi:hypothetical protein
VLVLVLVLVPVLVVGVEGALRVGVDTTGELSCEDATGEVTAGGVTVAEEAAGDDAAGEDVVGAVVGDAGLVVVPVACAAPDAALVKGGMIVLSTTDVAVPDAVADAGAAVEDVGAVPTGPTAVSSGSTCPDPQAARSWHIRAAAMIDFLGGVLDIGIKLQRRRAPKWRDCSRLNVQGMGRPMTS